MLFVNGIATGHTLELGAKQLSAMKRVFTGTKGPDHCQCALAEIEIYNSALTDKEILSIYNKHA